MRVHVRDVHPHEPRNVGGRRSRLPRTRKYLDKVILVKYAIIVL